ncbi:MAG: Uma2 family endonuclease [Vicinamibacterales bacterium]
MATTKLMTIEAFEQLADDGYRYELVDGELARMPPTGEGHGDVDRQFIWLLEGFIRPRGVEKLFVETAFVLSPDRQTVRQPDIAFVHAHRLRHDRDRERAVRLAPDLVIEIVSPTDRRSAVVAKAHEYLSYGVKLVWVVDPASRSITVFQSNGSEDVLGQNDTIDGEDVLPGFRATLRDIFQLRDR